jgi:demethylmenaquinone methyltransferase/2-methoxy-6-polyprenyl-1,4-benzoquinol methylase
MTQSTDRYDVVAPKWGDKMRTLGYYDGYLGFLSHPQRRPHGATRVIDVGAGTASFAEAWVAIHGPPQDLVLLEPSQAMLARGRAALARRGVQPQLVKFLLGDTELRPGDEVLAAHVSNIAPIPCGRFSSFAICCIRAGGCIWWSQNRIGVM